MFETICLKSDTICRALCMVENMQKIFTQYFSSAIWQKSKQITLFFLQDTDPLPGCVFKVRDECSRNKVGISLGKVFALILTIEFKNTRLRFC